MENYKDEELIELFLESNDEKYFNSLVLRYEKYIFNFVRQYIEDKQKAEDLTQEIFFRVWKNLFSFDISRNFKPWVFEIARNLVFDYLRKKKILKFSDFVPENFEIPLNLEERDKLNLEMFFEKLLAKLPILYREILFLRYYEELSFKEIGEILKIPENTARSYHKRALDTIKKITKDLDF